MSYCKTERKLFACIPLFRNHKNNALFYSIKSLIFRYLMFSILFKMASNYGSDDMMRETLFLIFKKLCIFVRNFITIK